ncbi:MAG: Na+/H+ antiporter subunit E [Burkholderiaceae bacterium]
MRRLVPAPALSMALWVAWLLLNGLSAAQGMLGAALAFAIPLFLGRRQMTAWSMSTVATAARLFCTVLIDIVVSAIGLARLILGPQASIRPGFVRVPLALRHSHGIVVLASIITLTPGTLTVDVGAGRDHLLVHVFDLDDPKGVVALIKRRYETPLLRIFGESAS